MPAGVLIFLHHGLIQALLIEVSVYKNYIKTKLQLLKP